MFLNFYENFETQFWWSLNHIHKHPQAKMLLQHLLGPSHPKKLATGAVVLVGVGMAFGCAA